MGVGLFSPCSSPVFIGGDIAPGQPDGCAPQIKMFDVFYLSSMVVGFLPSALYNNPEVAGFSVNCDGAAFLYFGGYDTEEGCDISNEGAVFLHIEEC